MPERCPLCGNLGWLLDGNINREPVTAELLPCVYPTCQFSMRPLASLVLHYGEFTSVARHPTDNFVMSVSKMPDSKETQ